MKGCNEVDVDVIITHRILASMKGRPTCCFQEEMFADFTHKSSKKIASWLKAPEREGAETQVKKRK